MREPEGMAEAESRPAIAEQRFLQLPCGLACRGRKATASISALAAILLNAGLADAQISVPSPENVWNSPASQRLKDEAKRFRSPVSPIDPLKLYTLAELI